MASSYNATSGRYDPSKIQPKFRDCAFASDKNANNFAQWTKLISGIIRNITGGAPLEAFLDQFLDRKILNNTEGDLSHEIRRGEVKILIDVKDDLSHEIRDVSTAEMQSDPYPDCMIRYILETLNAEEDIETLNVEDDTKTLNVEDYTETLNVEEALVIL